MSNPSQSHRARQGLVAPVPADPGGVLGPTPGAARGPRWRTSSRGLYVPADVPTTSHQRTLEASAVLRDDEAVTGWAALDWVGARWFDGTTDGATHRDVDLVARRHIAAQPGCVVSQEFLHPAEIVVVDGVPLTAHVRSVTFEMRYAGGLGDAVVALDMACYSDLVSISRGGGVHRCAGAGDRHPAGARRGRRKPTRTRGRRARRRCAGYGPGGLDCPGRCATPPSSPSTGVHVGTPDLIDPAAGAAWGSTTGLDHLSLVGASTDDRSRSAAYPRPRARGRDDGCHATGRPRRLHVACSRQPRAVARDLAAGCGPSTRRCGGRRRDGRPAAGTRRPGEAPLPPLPQGRLSPSGAPPGGPG